MRVHKQVCEKNIHNKHFFLCILLILIVGCGITPRKAVKNAPHGEKNLIGNKVPMRSWAVQPYEIFPIIAEVARTSFPGCKIHENFPPKRIHFWYFDSEQGDALLIMKVISQDSTSTLNLYKPRYGVTQPLITKDSIPITQFLIDLDNRIQALGIPAVFKFKVTP